MKSTNQLTFAAVRQYREPQMITPYGLPRLIAEANAAEFETFQEYCKEKWGWEKTYCYKLIDAAAVVKSLPMSAIADKITTESQARELAKVEPENRVAVIEKAGPNPTAKAIKEAAATFEPPRIKTSDDEIRDTAEQLGRMLPEVLGAAPAETPNEHRVAYYYLLLEELTLDALEKASDKQLVSMSVFAAQIPKRIKEELGRRRSLTTTSTIYEAHLLRRVHL